MAKQPVKGLGRGLEAIFEVESTPYSENIVHPATPSGTELVSIDRIVPNPNQPRQIFDDTALEELAASIRTLGIIQPLTLKAEKDGRYMIISGERRWRASQLAGLRELPAYVRNVEKDTLLEMALVENIQREDLNPIEIAQSLQRLVDEFSLSQEELADRVGKKRSTIANYLRLLGQPAEVQLALRDGTITMGHAKAIAGMEALGQLKILKTIIAKGLSVRQTEEIVKSSGEQKSAPVKIEHELPESYSLLTEQLTRLFSDKVAIKRAPSGGGQITIGFTTDDEIEQFIAKLQKVD